MLIVCVTDMARTMQTNVCGLELHSIVCRSFQLDACSHHHDNITIDAADLTQREAYTTLMPPACRTVNVGPILFVPLNLFLEYVGVRVEGMERQSGPSSPYPWRICHHSLVSHYHREPHPKQPLLWLREQESPCKRARAAPTRFGPQERCRARSHPKLLRWAEPAPEF